MKEEPKLPTPHLDKFKALQKNPRLPEADKPRVEKALEKYDSWVKELSRL